MQRSASDMSISKSFKSLGNGVRNASSRLGLTRGATPVQHALHGGEKSMHDPKTPTSRSNKGGAATARNYGAESRTAGKNGLNTSRLAVTKSYVHLGESSFNLSEGKPVVAQRPLKNNFRSTVAPEAK